MSLVERLALGAFWILCDLWLVALTVMVLALLVFTVAEEAERWRRWLDRRRGGGR